MKIRFFFFVRILSIVFGCVAVTLYFLRLYITQNFGDIDAERLFWTLQNSIVGFDTTFVRIGLKYLFLMLVSWGGVIAFVVYGPRAFFSILKLCVNPKAEIKKIKVSLSKIYLFAKSNLSIFREAAQHTLSLIERETTTIFLPIFILLLSVACSYSTYHRLDKTIGFTEWKQLQNTPIADDFFKQHYKVPSWQQVSFKEKRNLLVVLNESLETTWASNKIEGAPLLSSMMAHRNNAQFVNNLVQTPGTCWTAGATTAWAFGLPLKLPVDGNDYLSRRGYLPNAQSIFDVLEKNGYKLVLICGSDSRFAGQYNLFSSHGKFEIKDKKYWMEKGFQLSQYQGSGWGYSDSFVLDRAFEEYEKQRKGNEPFLIFVETIDLHNPGWCPPERVFFKDVRDAIVENDKVASKFFDKVLPLLGNKTSLAWIGDHLFMGNPLFIRDIPRHLFNAFWGATPKIPKNKISEIATPVDIAPTLLELAGASWDDSQYGIGISLFSECPSIAQRYGLHEFNQALGRRSLFYKNFY